MSTAGLKMFRIQKYHSKYYIQCSSHMKLLYVPFPIKEKILLDRLVRQIREMQEISIKNLAKQNKVEPCPIHG